MHLCKNEHNRLCKSKVCLYNFYSIHFSVRRVLMIASFSEKKSKWGISVRSNFRGFDGKNQFLADWLVLILTFKSWVYVHKVVGVTRLYRLQRETLEDRRLTAAETRLGRRQPLGEGLDAAGDESAAVDEVLRAREAQTRPLRRAAPGRPGHHQAGKKFNSRWY